MNCVSRHDCLSGGFWLSALFMSAVVKYLPFIFVETTWIGSIGQLPLDSSISELRYLASRTIFNDSPLAILARIKTGLIRVFPFGFFSLFTGDIISYCSRMSSSLLTLSCK